MTTDRKLTIDEAAALLDEAYAIHAPGPVPGVRPLAVLEAIRVAHQRGRDSVVPAVTLTDNADELARCHADLAALIAERDALRDAMDLAKHGREEAEAERDRARQELANAQRQCDDAIGDTERLREQLHEALNKGSDGAAAAWREAFQELLRHDRLRADVPF